MRWRWRSRDTRIIVWCVNLFETAFRSQARVTTFTYCRLTTYHVGSRCFCNTPKGRFPRSFRGDGDTTTGAKSSDCTPTRGCNRDQLKAGGWNARYEARGSRTSIYRAYISITRNAWERLTQRRASIRLKRVSASFIKRGALHGSHASRTYLTGIKSTTTRSG